MYCEYYKKTPLFEAINLFHCCPLKIYLMIALITLYNKNFSSLPAKEF